MRDEWGAGRFTESCCTGSALPGKLCQFSGLLCINLLGMRGCDWIPLGFTMWIPPGSRCQFRFQLCYTYCKLEPKTKCPGLRVMRLFFFFFPFQIHPVFVLLLLFLWKRCHVLWTVYYDKACLGRKQYFLVQQSLILPRKSKNLHLPDHLGRWLVCSLNPVVNKGNTLLCII